MYHCGLVIWFNAYNGQSDRTLGGGIQGVNTLFQSAIPDVDMTEREMYWYSIAKNKIYSYC